jgi:hypothetical protein
MAGLKRRYSYGMILMENQKRRFSLSRALNLAIIYRIAVDTQGFPHAVAVTTAEVTDRKGALQALERCQSELNQAQSLLADSGYVGEPFAQGRSRYSG